MHLHSILLPANSSIFFPFSLILLILLLSPSLSSAGLYLRIFAFLLNTVASVLYVVEVIMSDVAVYRGFAVLSCYNLTINLSEVVDEADSTNHYLIL